MVKAKSAGISGYVRARISWMIRADMDAVLEIEKNSFEFPWTEEEFIRCLRQRQVIGLVVREGNEVEGFCIYELHERRIHLLSMAVDPNHRRRGVAGEMIQKLTGKLSHDRRNRIVLEIRESNLAAQLCFRKHGFRATGLLKDFYEDSPEDAYLFQYREAAAVQAEPTKKES